MSTVKKYTLEEKLYFGSNLKRYMQEQNQKANDLSKKLHISPPRISAAFHGDVTDANMELIAEYYGIPMENFLIPNETYLDTLKNDYFNLMTKQKKLSCLLLLLGSFVVILSHILYSGSSILIWTKLSPILETNPTNELLELWKTISRYQSFAEILFPFTIIFFFGLLSRLSGSFWRKLWLVVSACISIIAGILFGIYYYYISGKWSLGNFLHLFFLEILVMILLVVVHFVFGKKPSKKEVFSK